MSMGSKYLDFVKKVRISGFKRNLRRVKKEPETIKNEKFMFYSQLEQRLKEEVGKSELYLNLEGSDIVVRYLDSKLIKVKIAYYFSKFYKYTQPLVVGYIFMQLIGNHHYKLSSILIGLNLGYNILAFYAYEYYSGRMYFNMYENYTTLRSNFAEDKVRDEIERVYCMELPLKFFKNYEKVATYLPANHDKELASIIYKDGFNGNLKQFLEVVKYV